MRRVLHPLPLVCALTFLVTACGPGELPAVDAGDSGDADAGPVLDDAGPAVAPTVLSTVPADGEAGVGVGQLLSLVFSAPMDITSVEEAFSSGSLPDITFIWNDDGTMVSVVPAGGLELAEGEGLDPSVIEARSYSYTIGTSATDTEGVALEEELTVAFTTQKRMYANVPPVAELTRTMLSTGVIHGADNPTLYVGDSEFTAATQMKTFITLDLSVIPADVEIVEAALRVRQAAVNGAPYETLGDLQVEHVSYAEVGPNAFGAAALESFGALSEDASAGFKSAAVTSALAADYDERELNSSRSQYRLSFPLPHDGDDVGDSAELVRDTLLGKITYRAD